MFLKNNAFPFLSSTYDVQLYLYSKNVISSKLWDKGNVDWCSVQEVTSHSSCSVDEIRKQGLYYCCTQDTTEFLYLKGSMSMSQTATKEQMFPEWQPSFNLPFHWFSDVMWSGFGYKVVGFYFWKVVLSLWLNIAFIKTMKCQFVRRAPVWNM